MNWKFYNFCYCH